MAMAGLVQVSFSFLFVFFLRLLVDGDVLVFCKLAHDFFNPPFHHAEVLFGVDRFGLGLSLNILDLFDGPVFTGLALEAAVYAGCGLGRFMEHGLELEFDWIVVELFAHD